MDQPQNIDSLSQTVESATITAISAASKTPFRTAFFLTIGIGLARITLFLGFVLGCSLIYKFLF